MLREHTFISVPIFLEIKKLKCESNLFKETFTRCGLQSILLSDQNGWSSQSRLVVI